MLGTKCTGKTINCGKYTVPEIELVIHRPKIEENFIDDVI